MKNSKNRISFLLIIFLICPLFTINAQQRYKDQWIAGVKGGYMPSKGYEANIFLERFIGKSYSSIKLEGIYLNQDIPSHITDVSITGKSYGAGISYNYSLEKLIPSPFYINLSLGGVGVYQKPSYDDSFISLDAEDKFVYGLTTSVQFEVIVYKSLSFFIEPKAYYFLNSDLRKINGSLGAGVKVYL